MFKSLIFEFFKKKDIVKSLSVHATVMLSLGLDSISSYIDQTKDAKKKELIRESQIIQVSFLSDTDYQKLVYPNTEASVLPQAINQDNSNAVTNDISNIQLNNENVPKINDTSIKQNTPKINDENIKQNTPKINDATIKQSTPTANDAKNISNTSIVDKGTLVPPDNKNDSKNDNKKQDRDENNTKIINDIIKPLNPQEESQKISAEDNTMFKASSNNAMAINEDIQLINNAQKIGVKTDLDAVDQIDITSITNTINNYSSVKSVNDTTNNKAVVKINPMLKNRSTDFIQYQIDKCWQKYSVGQKQSDIIISLIVRYDKNGNLLSIEEYILNENHKNDDIYQSMKQKAVQAVKDCNPLKQIPIHDYGTWRKLILNFKYD